jgi:ATP/ADP translocase
MESKTISNEALLLNGLLLLFIALKLTGHIAWSWFWVLSPIWLPLVIVVGVALFFVAVAGLSAKFAEKESSRGD